MDKGYFMIRKNCKLSGLSVILEYKQDWASCPKNLSKTLPWKHLSGFLWLSTLTEASSRVMLCWTSSLCPSRSGIFHPHSALWPRSWSVDHTSRLPCPLAYGSVQPIKSPRGKSERRRKSGNSEWFLSMWGRLHLAMWLNTRWLLPTRWPVLDDSVLWSQHSPSFPLPFGLFSFYLGVL